MSEERIITVDIRLSRGWIFILSCLIVSGILFAIGAIKQQPTMASTGDTTAASSAGQRQFYLTVLGYHGSGVKNACANGYHTASFWEIVDPSNLKYNKDLGYTEADSAFGPPAGEAGLYGWVHTGYISYSGNVAGQANCLNYTIGSYFQYGTAVALHSLWTSGVQDIGPWDVQSMNCLDQKRVWCIED